MNVWGKAGGVGELRSVRLGSGTELLVNRLVELGTPFDFMEYPGRTHSMAEAAGTHYHMFSLLARYLQEHLAAGAGGKN